MTDAEQPASKVELRQAVQDAQGILGKSIFDRNNIREKIRSKPSVKEEELLNVVHEIIEDGVIESLEELALLHETKLRLQALARGRDGYNENEVKALAYSRVLSAEYHPDILLRYYKKIELYLELIDKPFVKAYLQKLSPESKIELETLERATAQHLRAVTPITKQYVAIYNYLVLMKSDTKTPEQIKEAAKKIFPGVASEKKFNPIGRITFITPNAPAMEFSITSLTIPSQDPNERVQQNKLMDALALLQTDISRFTSMEPVEGIDIKPFNKASPPDKLIETLISAVLTTQLRMGQERGISDDERDPIQADQDSCMKYLFDNMTTLGEDGIFDLTTLILDMFEKKAEGDVTYKSTGSSPPLTPESRKQSDAEVNNITSRYTQHFEEVINVLKPNAVLVIEDEYNKHGRLAALRLLDAMVTMRSVPRFLLGKLPLIPDTTLKELRTEMMGSLRIAWGLPEDFDIWEENSLNKLTKEQWNTLTKNMKSTLKVLNENREKIVQNMEKMKADFDALLAFRANCHYETLVRTDRDEEYYNNNKETKFTGKEFATLTPEQKRAAYEIILRRLLYDWHEYMEQNQIMLNALTGVIKVHNRAGAELEKLRDKTEIPWGLIIDIVGAAGLAYAYKKAGTLKWTSKSINDNARNRISSNTRFETNNTIRKKIMEIEEQIKLDPNLKKDAKVMRWLRNSKKALRSPWVTRGAISAGVLLQASLLAENYSEMKEAEMRGNTEVASNRREKQTSLALGTAGSLATLLAQPSMAGGSFKILAVNAIRSPGLLLSLSSGVLLSAPVAAAEIYSNAVYDDLNSLIIDEQQLARTSSGKLLSEIDTLSKEFGQSQTAATGFTLVQWLARYLTHTAEERADEDFKNFTTMLKNTNPARTARYAAYFMQNTPIMMERNQPKDVVNNGIETYKKELGERVSYKMMYIHANTSGNMDSVPVKVLEDADTYAALMQQRRLLRDAKKPMILELSDGTQSESTTLDLTSLGIDFANQDKDNIHNMNHTTTIIAQFNSTMKSRARLEQLALSQKNPTMRREIIIGELAHAINAADKSLMQLKSSDRAKVRYEIVSQLSMPLKKLDRYVSNAFLDLTSYNKIMQDLKTILEVRYADTEIRKLRTPPGSAKRKPQESPMKQKIEQFDRPLMVLVRELMQ